ncbi:hypothetical protein BDW66DRAFT_26936 [Aspergillus desertorum]
MKSHSCMLSGRLTRSSSPELLANQPIEPVLICSLLLPHGLSLVSATTLLCSRPRSPRIRPGHKLGIPTGLLHLVFAQLGPLFTYGGSSVASDRYSDTASKSRLIYCCCGPEDHRKQSGTPEPYHGGVHPRRHSQRASTLYYSASVTTAWGILYPRDG